MNERIVKLITEADTYAWTVAEKYVARDCCNDGEVNYLWEDAFREKFAELIVRECARVARATPSPNFHEHLKQQLGHTWDMASIEAGKQIVKHFGVEE